MKNPLTSLTKRLARKWPAAILVRRRGARFLVHPQNWIDNRIVAGAPFEHRQIEAAKAEIAARNIDLVIDIGANIGLYTVLLGLLPQVKTVLAFEPVRRNFAQLMGNVFVNGLSNKVDAYRFALGAEPGSVTMHIDPTSTGVSRVDLSTTHRQSAAFAETETVDLCRFDDVCTLKGRRAFVKVDVEGAAVGVLEGMHAFLRDNDVVVQVELSETERDGVLRVLTDAGLRKLRMIEADAMFAKID